MGWSGGHHHTTRKVGNWKSTFLSGEGPVADLTGPGTVYLQTRSADAFSGGSSQAANQQQLILQRMAANDWRGETYAALQLASTEQPVAHLRRSPTSSNVGSARRPWCRYGSSPTPLVDQALAQRWAFVSWLCSEVLADRVVTQPLVPMPLRTAVVVPTLFEHRDADPSDPRATIWLVGRFTAEGVRGRGAWCT